MTKYTFLLHHSQQEKLLENLGGLGVIDITINKYEPSEQENDALQYVSRLKTIYETLKNASFPHDLEVVDNKIKDVEGFLECVTNTKERLDEIALEIIKLEKDLSETEPWGDFSKEKIELLKQQGLTLKYFIFGEKQYKEEWEDEYPLYVINRSRGSIFFVLVVDTNAPQIQHPNFGLETREPAMSYFDLKTKFDNLLAEKRTLLTTLQSLATDIKIVEDEQAVAAKEVHYLRVKQGNATAAEGSVIIIEGWAPVEKCEAIDKYIESDNETISFKDTPTLEDNPPILLKNNWFSRTNELITRLYSLPNYHEPDITAYSAPFFVFFVGVCLCDLGYGLLILALSIVGFFKYKSPSARPVVGLVFLCSISAMIMGCLTGAFFGMSLAEYQFFAPVKDLFIKQNSMFTFALAVGVIQILYAITLRSIFNIRRSGLKYGLSHIGWGATILTLCAALLLPMAGINSFTMESLPFKIIISVTLALTILFTNPDKGILSNLGLGIYGLYNNVTGLLGDVLSYIRLFALGLSGGVIAGIFNDLAVGMSGDVPVVKYLIMAMILLIGHGINLFMAVIGSFVHPLRLTFVEFYKNVGFEGGGRAYTPFSGRTKK
ncbi:MAG: V-type ATPase 116kDa subunit family protein [Rikenellaceae bacterium]